MKLMQKLLPPPAVTDDIPEKIHKRLHFVYFFLKCMGGVFVFLILWSFVPMLLSTVDSDIPDKATAESPFLRHEYCGTFFVEINPENSFASQQAYEDYLAAGQPEETPHTPLQTALKITGWLLEGTAIALCLFKKKVKEKLPESAFRYLVVGLLFVGSWLFSQHIMNAMLILLIVMLFCALRSGDRKTLFSERASDFFLIAGLVWLIGNIYMDIDGFRNMYHATAEGLTGVFAHPRYYCHLYNIAAIPVIVFSCGLILRRHELHLRQGSTVINARLLNVTAWMTAGGTAAFTLYRMGVRIYELVKILSGAAYSVWLPFTVMDVPYNRLVELPYDLANTPEEYRNVIVFRFVKDFPVAILSAVAVYFFVRFLLAAAKAELNTPQNRKRLNIAIIMLLIASLWFNGMGFAELGFFDNGFTGVYGDVTYTIALRSMTEPALYALILWFLKNFLQAVPAADLKKEEIV